MSSWSEIVSNYRTLLEGTFGYRYGGVIDLAHRSSLPTSNWDKSYTIQMFGMPQPIMYYNSAVDLTYTVRLQISWELNENDPDLNDYNNAISDLEAIIVKRLDTRTWQNNTTTIGNITHISTGPFQFISTTDEHFAVVSIDFQVVVRQIII